MWLERLQLSFVESRKNKISNGVAEAGRKFFDVHKAFVLKGIRIWKASHGMYVDVRRSITQVITTRLRICFSFICSGIQPVRDKRQK